MKTTTKQTIWAGITLATMLGGFKIHESTREEQLQQHILEAESAIRLKKPEEARNHLAEIENTYVISPKTRDPYLVKAAALQPQLLRLEVKLAFGAKEDQLRHIRDLIIQGDYAQTLPAIMALRKSPSIENETLNHQFAQRFDQLCERFERIQQQTLPDVLVLSPVERKDIAKEIEALIEINTAYAKAPDSSWLGSDRKSLQTKKEKLVFKHMNSFLKEQPLHNQWLDHKKDETADAEKIVEYLLVKDTAPEKKSRLSLKTTRAEYEQKIEQLKQSIQEHEQTRKDLIGEFNQQYHLPGEAQNAYQLAETYGIDFLHCLPYTLRAIDTLIETEEALANEIEGTDWSEVMKKKLYDSSIAVVDQWSIALTAHTPNSPPDVQALSQLAVSLQRDIQELLKAQKMDPAVRENHLTTLRSAARWMIDLFTQPPEAAAPPVSVDTPPPAH